MNISEYSENTILHTLSYWQVSKDYVDPMFNYLVYGFSPGSFFTSVLANDFKGSIQRSHPLNQIDELKRLVGWIEEYVPKQAQGSYENVYAWCRISEQDRKVILENHNLILTPERETWHAVKGDLKREKPIFW